MLHPAGHVVELIGTSIPELTVFPPLARLSRLARPYLRPGWRAERAD